jgi:zinc protease
MSQMKSILANQRSTPEFVYAEAQTETMFQGHPRRKIPSPEQLSELNLDKALAFYKDRFADASDFTFVFVGTVNPDTLKPLVEQYLGSLPSTGRKETFRDMGVTRVKGVVEKVVEKGIEPKSETSITFHGPFAYNQDERIAIRAMTEVFQTRLRESLREELGGTYSVGVSAGYERIPKTEFTVDIGFGSDPGRAEALSKRVFEEIAKFKAEGPTEKQVNDAKAALNRDFETNVKQNAYVLSQLAFKYEVGDAPETLLEIPSYYEKITAATIQASAKKYLDTTNYVKVVLMPEKK